MPDKDQALKTGEKSATAVKTVGVFGSHTAGAGWAARYLARGLDVVVFAPDPGSEEQWRTAIDRAWPVLEKLGLMPGAARDRLHFAADLAGPARQVDFIQISHAVTEIGLLRQIENATPPSVIIATDSTEVPAAQGEVFNHPGRFILARAHTPVYLLPLVEIVGFPETAGETLDHAEAFYRWAGMYPVRVSEPTPESLANRLLGALRREAQALIESGTIEAEQVDKVLTYGPALHWAIFGVLSSPHQPGLAQQPDPDPAQLQQADEAILGIMRALRAQSLASGQIIDDWETWRYTDRSARRWSPGAEIGRPLSLFQCYVDPGWIDYNGHMTEASYLTAFGHASDALFRYIGIEEGYRAAGLSFYTVETHINYYREVSAGRRLDFSTQLLGLDKKRVHIFHRMVDAATATQVATTEQMLIHVDMKAARASRIRPDVFRALQAIRDAHQDMPIPAQVGRQMKLKGG